MDGRPVDLARARREAKTLLRAARAGDVAARARVVAGARPGAALRLSDAQLAIARELGARSWPALVRDAQARTASAPAPSWSGRRARGATTPRRCSRSTRRSGAKASTPRWCSATSSASAPRWPAIPASRGARSAPATGSPCSTSPTRPSSAASAATGSWPAPPAARGGRRPRRRPIAARRGRRRGPGVPGAAARRRRPGPRRDGPRTRRPARQAGDGAVAARARPAGIGASARTRCTGRSTPTASADMLRLLVEHGADLEASFDGSGRTPYGVAVRSGRPRPRRAARLAGRDAPRRAAR